MENAHFEYGTLRLTKTTSVVDFSQATASNRSLLFQYCQYAAIGNIFNILLAGSETTYIQNVTETEYRVKKFKKTVDLLANTKISCMVFSDVGSGIQQNKPEAFYSQPILQGNWKILL